MVITVTPLPLHLRHPFRIAHGTSTIRNNALITLGDGIGEAALPPYYPTTFEDVKTYVEGVSHLLQDVMVSDPLELIATLDRLPKGPSPAKAAIDQALHDLWGKRLGLPLYKLLGLSQKHIPASSYALPIPESLEHLDQQLATLLDFPFLKLKLGSGDVEMDLAITRRTREQYAGQLCVDVNGGWTLDQAVWAIPAMHELDLVFVEQPIRPKENDEWHLLKRLLPEASPPLIADESVQGLDDIFELAGAVQGINIKLAKCGGIRMAQQMISLARSLDMSVILGCMIESSVALTAAAHLGALVDYLDLDGQLHLAQDPFSGLSFNSGVITLPERPGLGVVPVH